MKASKSHFNTAVLLKIEFLPKIKMHLASSDILHRKSHSCPLFCVDVKIFLIQIFKFFVKFIPRYFVCLFFLHIFNRLLSYFYRS